MENVQPWQLLTALGVVLFIGAMLLIWGDRPGLAAAIRRRFAERVTSSDEGTPTDRYEREIASFAPATTTPQPDNNPIAITATERNALLFAGRADALATLVHAKKVGETEGIKIVFGVGPSSSNKTYQAAREMLKARLERLEPKRDLTPEQEAMRASLGLPNRKNA